MTEEQPVTRSLAEDLRIDRNNLVGEWEEQPTLYMYWADEYAYAAADRDRAKEQLDLVAADLDTLIRADHAAYGLVKVVNDAVAATVKQQPQYKEAQERLMELNLMVNRMAAARSAMEHKRRALDNMTSLQLAGFYGANTAASGVSIEKGKKGQERFQEKMNTRHNRGLVE